MLLINSLVVKLFTKGRTNNQHYLLIKKSPEFDVNQDYKSMSFNKLNLSSISLDRCRAHDQEPAATTQNLCRT